MKCTLVTGATGFLGRHLVEELRRTQPENGVRVLCRGASPWDVNGGIEVARGDVTCLEDVLSAAKDVREIYHLAGMVSRNPRDRETLYRIHIEGTRNICEGARRHKIERVVVVSSSGTVAVSREAIAHNEDSGFKNELVAEWPYYLSKIFAEKTALDFSRRHGVPVVIANPSLILGPGDDRESSTGDIALFLRGQILAVPRGGVSFVDVRDAAQGLVAAMRRGRAGERYLLGGANWTFRELIENVARISGRHAPRLQPSLRWSLFCARILRRVFPIFGSRFELDDASIKMGSCFWYCDTGKARSELEFLTRDPVTTVCDTVEDVRRRREGRRQGIGNR
jgi:dihydroflavonol-4-reductase